MADFNLNLKQTASPKMLQRTVLLGRVKMAQAIHMRETEWAKILSEIERDPLFQELMGAQHGSERVIKYKRMGRSQLSGQFYEMQDANVIGGGGGESPESLLDKKKHLLKLIQKIGQEKFEKYFLYREECLPIGEVAKFCDISESEALALHDFVMEMSIQAEFYHPSSLQPHNLVKPTMIGKILKNEDGSYSISFFSPHMARGTYEINGDVLKKWQKDKKLDRVQASKLRRYVGLLELSNLKQGAFWRVVEYLLQIQKDYFASNDMTKLAPVSLRHIARTLQFAPSTISRVISNKSIMLPWDHEVLIAHLMPGQRKVVLNILEKMMPEGGQHMTDAALSLQIQNTFGIKVSRRTVTACRHVINKQSAS